MTLEKIELQDDGENLNSQIFLLSFIKFSDYLKPIVIFFFKFKMANVSRHS